MTLRTFLVRSQRQICAIRSDARASGLLSIIATQENPLYPLNDAEIILNGFPYQATFALSRAVPFRPFTSSTPAFTMPCL